MRLPHNRLSPRFVGCALVALWFGASAAGAAPLSPVVRGQLEATGRVEKALLDALEADARARVLISFRAPEAPQATARLAADHRAALRARGDAILARLAREDFALRRRFKMLPGLAGEIRLGGLRRLLADPQVRFVALDRGGSASSNESRALIGADLVAASGLSGAGVTIAVLDSGIDTDHPDLSDALVAQECFCQVAPPGGVGCCPDGSERQSGSGAAEDDNGHGTHVAGVLVSKGQIAPRGLAPDASLVAIKVLDADGNFCCTSDILAALDWIAAERPDVDLVNLSLTNDPGPPPGFPFAYGGHCDGVVDGIADLYKASIDALHTAGVAVFAATGNHGLYVAVPAPACVEKAISVSAVYDANLGPVAFGTCTDFTTAPGQYMCVANSNAVTDLVAPGGAVTSAHHEAPWFQTRFGTSQAVPMAAGCAALLLEAKPTLDPDALDALLRTATSATVDPPGFSRAFPLLDCEQALLALPEPKRAAAALVALCSLGGCALASNGRRGLRRGREERC